MPLTLQSMTVFRTLLTPVIDCNVRGIFFAIPWKQRKENASNIAIYDGFQNFADARARGKGVLFLTAHFGGWEIGSFVHSLNGNPMNIVVRPLEDRKSTRLNSSHANISYAVFCLKKKKQK